MSTRPIPPQFANAAHSSLEAFQDLADIMLNASEQMLNLHLELAREMCDQVSSHPLPTDPQDFGKQIQRSLSTQQNSLSQASKYLHQLQQIYFSTQAELGGLNSRSFHDFGEAMQTMFTEMSKIGPSLIQSTEAETGSRRSTRKKS